METGRYFDLVDMKKLFILFLLWSSLAQAVTPISAGKVQGAIGLNGWLNKVVVEIMVANPPTIPETRYIAVKWAELDPDGTVTSHCKIGDLSNMNVVDILYGKGPQTLGLALFYWLNALPENTNPWCLQ
jgi:hypothetical protein